MRYPDNPAQLNYKQQLAEYYLELRAELDEILAYWTQNTQDNVCGGFIGRIDEDNRQHTSAPKGAVLNARILWAFSAGYKITADPEHHHLASMAYNYFTANFIDKEYGGVFWSLHANGQPLDTKKQIYALAFAVYGLSAYFEISNNKSAKDSAIELYRQIERHSFDAENGGYLEAFTRDWKTTGDLRLSLKDVNEKKTMNTHLHILEAYTALYRIWPDERLKKQIKNLLQNFRDHFADPATGHLVLFFDGEWNSRATTVSFGHDIEAAWLLMEAAEAIHDHSVSAAVKELSVKIAAAANEGLDADGALWYEYEPEDKRIVKEKHWWVQAEAMVGFFNNWQLTNDDTYLQKSLQSWQYICSKIKDKLYGEWLWGRNDDDSIMKGQDKAGIWKCPYHNSRACIEIINRIHSKNIVAYK